MPEAPSSQMGIPPVVAAIALLFALSLMSADAANPETNNPPPATAERLDHFRQLFRLGQRPGGLAQCDVAIFRRHGRPGCPVVRRRRGGGCNSFSAKNGKAGLVRDDSWQHRRAVRYERQRDVANQNARQNRRRRDEAPACLRDSARVVEPGRARAGRIRGGRGFSGGDFVQADFGTRTKRAWKP